LVGKVYLCTLLEIMRQPARLLACADVGEASLALQSDL
jgi:hypothetical protein